jgi:hypothetical protein
VSNPISTFATEDEAYEWMAEGFERDDERCVDNHRFAYKDDDEGMAKYREAEEQGCCGFYDCDIIVGGRPATIGCNYGH